jgi:uncharacterized RDD family membrane protein YckC
VLMVAGLVYGVATNQRHALAGAFGLQVLLFFVLGAYFVGFWCRQGQTLAMRTWHIRLVRVEGADSLRPPGPLRAAARYLLAWLWFLPALAALHFSGLKGGAATVAILLAGAVTYALLSRLHPQRQFLHDALCGTRLVTWRPPPKKLAVPASA